MQRRVSARIKAAQTKSANIQQERDEDLGSESPLTELEDEQPPSPSPPKKRRRKTKVVEPVVYDIPPVESKMTTFRGTVFKIVCRVVGRLRILSLHVASRSVGLRESPYPCWNVGTSFDSRRLASTRFFELRSRIPFSAVGSSSGRFGTPRDFGLAWSHKLSRLGLAG